MQVATLVGDVSLALVHEEAAVASVPRASSAVFVKKNPWGNSHVSAELPSRTKGTAVQREGTRRYGANALRRASSCGIGPPIFISIR